MTLIEPLASARTHAGERSVSDLFAKAEPAPTHAGPLTSQALSERSDIVASILGEPLELRLGWRDYLADLGVAGAIVESKPATPGRSPVTFFIGFDALGYEPDLGTSLLAFASSCWRLQDELSVFDAGDAYQRFASQERPNDTATADSLDGFGQAFTVSHRGPEFHSRAVFLAHSGEAPFRAQAITSLRRTFPMFLCVAFGAVALRQLQQQTLVLKGMLDWLNFGMLILDAKGRVQTSNAAGDALLADGSWLRTCPDGTLSCCHQADTKALRAAVESACLGKNSRREVVLKLNGRDDDWRLAYVLRASPSSRTRDRRALMIVLPRHPGTASAEMLNVLGLLPSEQRFLLSFLDSSSLAEGAARAGVSDETAKTYLKRIRSKLGVHRQIELARLIYGQSPPLRSGGSEAIAAEGGDHALL